VADHAAGSAGSAGPATVDSAAFRQVLGYFATGVTVITAHGPDEPVSLDPPLVLFCAAHSSSTWPLIREAGKFTVNILAEDQEHVSRAFAAKDVDRFEAVGHRDSAHGSPILNDTLAFVDCEIEAMHEAGDHVLVVGRVLELGVQRDGVGPLLFFRGGYGNFAP
jgi:3-hydroxy-9,10-secoandrosta-1,3,5(10)-triene-9,17-dione monooxygenase reductase component